MANPEHLKILKQGVADWNQWREENPGIVPDLSGANLQGADLRMVNLQGANLINTDLVETDLLGANLEGGTLDGANFNGANLIGVSLEDAYLDSSDFSATNLTTANLTRAFFAHTNLTKTDLSYADLSEATLMWVNLEEANLMGAKLCNTYCFNTQYDNAMQCRGINVQGCYGSQRFVRHVIDLDYIEETKEKHPIRHYLWKLTSDCGRSWLRLAGCCVAILYFFWALFDLLEVEQPLVTSIMAFTSFGFVDSKAHTKPELVLICIEAILGYAMFGALVSLIANQMTSRS